MIAYPPPHYAVLSPPFLVRGIKRERIFDLWNLLRLRILCARWLSEVGENTKHQLMKHFNNSVP